MINIAELLKDCPKGTKLYSPLFGEVEFSYIGGTNRRIWVYSTSSMRMFSNEGKYCFTHHGETVESQECLLFPSKEVRTWDGWKASVGPEFKVGDWITDGTCKVKITAISNTYYWYAKNCILGEIESIDKEYHLWSVEDAEDGDVLVTEDYIFIFKYVLHGGVHLYCHYDIDAEEFDSDILDAVIGNIHDKGAHFQPATQKQRNLLFKKMHEAGYQWYAGRKELCKIIEPKFKVGDDIKIGNIIETIAEVANAIRKYYCESGRIISFENQDLWYLVPKPHYDIANFKPKQWVLVRDDDEWEWALTRFSYLSNGSASLFVCINGASFQQCIPFEGNEHLLGNADMPSEEYINW